MTDYTLNDALMEVLSSFEGTSNDKQMQFLEGVLGTSGAGSLNDYWLQYCQLNGTTDGTTQEQIYQFMKASLGATEGTYNDIQHQFWESLIPP